MIFNCFIIYSLLLSTFYFCIFSVLLSEFFISVTSQNIFYIFWLPGFVFEQNVLASLLHLHILVPPPGVHFFRSFLSINFFFSKFNLFKLKQKKNKPKTAHLFFPPPSLAMTNLNKTVSLEYLSNSLPQLTPRLSGFVATSRINKWWY